MQKQIFEIAGGYPIITYFLAEHYKQHGNINVERPILNLNQYYEELLVKVSTKSLLCIFATTNSFFTREELTKYSDYLFTTYPYSIPATFENVFPKVFVCLILEIVLMVLVTIPLKIIQKRI